MAYTFFPEKGSEIIDKCNKFGAVNVADMVNLHDALQKKYPKIGAPINIDLKKTQQSKTEVNVTRALEGTLTIKECVKLGGVSNLKLKFGNGSSGNRGLNNRGNNFEPEFATDILKWWEGTTVSNSHHLKAIKHINQVYNLKDSSSLKVDVVGGANTPRPIQFKTNIVLENTKGIGTDVGKGVTDVTLTKSDGDEIYLSLKFGATTTFFNVGVRGGRGRPPILTPDEIESGVITNKHGKKLLKLFGIDERKFCLVFKGGKGVDPSYVGNEIAKYSKPAMKKLLESGIGHGYHIIHKFENGTVVSKEMSKTAMTKAANTGSLRIYYGGKTGTGRRINMEMSSSVYKFSLNIRDTQGRDGYPTRMMCDFKTL